MLLKRLARFCYDRRRYVLVAWLLGLVLVTGLSKAAGGKSATNFTLPGTESQRAFDLLKQNFPARSGDTADIVFAASGPQGIRAPEVRQRMVAAFAAAQSASHHVSGVTSPYSPQGARQISADGHIGFGELQFDVRSNDLPSGAATAIHDAIVRAAQPGSALQVAFSGNAFATRSSPGGTEIVGVVAAIVILLIAFGSVLAMGLPILIALTGVIIGLGLIGLLANFMQVVSFTGLIAAMIGIGVGIDYALFIVTRYRQGLHDGMEPGDAIATAITTSGRAVLLAGSTVVIALVGMFVMGLSFINPRRRDRPQGHDQPCCLRPALGRVRPWLQRSPDRRRPPAPARRPGGHAAPGRGPQGRPRRGQRRPGGDQQPGPPHRRNLTSDDGLASQRGLKPEAGLIG
jgi:putative drug exporter of the RND superfamily